MIKLDKWQEEVLEHEGDILLCTGRRVGKTYIMARKAIDHMFKYGKAIIVVSLTEDQAMIIIQMALAYAREQYKSLIGKGKYKPTLKTLTLMRKGKPVKMISRPVGNTGDAMRGFEGGVLIVDEASRMPRLFWIAAKPVLLTQAGEIWMCSTPHGKQGYFWDRFDETYNKQEEDARFKVFYTTTEDVMKNRPINESWTEAQRIGALKILEEDKKEMSELEYGQEYQGLFLDELRQFFSEEWIERVCVLEIDDGVVRNRSYFLGVDVGAIHDPSTFQIVDGTDRKKIFQKIGYEKLRIMPHQTYNEIKALNNKWNFRKIGIDDRGMGTGVMGLLLDDSQTKRKSIGLDNAKRVVDADENKKRLMKEEMYVYTQVKGERNELKLLNTDAIKDSFRSVQYEYQEKRMRIFGNKTHSAEGVIRGVYLVKTKGLNIMAFC